LFVRLTDQQFLSVMLSWMCCAIQNINKPQRPEDQIKEAAQLVLAAHSLEKYYESKNLRTLCYIYLLLLLYEISLFFHVTGPWWVLDPTKKTIPKLGEDVTFFPRKWGLSDLFLWFGKKVWGFKIKTKSTIIFSLNKGYWTTFQELLKNSQLVFFNQNCSDLLWQKIVLLNEKKFWNLRLKVENLQKFEITRTIYSNSESSEQFLVTEHFFNLFLEVSHIS